MPVYGLTVRRRDVLLIYLGYLYKKQYIMSKIKITEEQLKRLTERRHSYISNEEEVEESELTMNPDAEISEEDDKVEEQEETEVEPTEEEKAMNESIMKIKSQFSRFL